MEERLFQSETTFTAGLVRLRWLTRFVPYIFIAAIVWALYAALLGYLGGSIFKDRPIFAVLIAFGIAALVTASVEGWRRFRK